MTTKSVAKKKIGRPTKYTPAVEKKVAEALSLGLYFDQACVMAGISKRTGYYWLEQGAEGKEPYVSFLHACEKADASAEGDALARIRMGELQWQAQAWFLERRHHNRWARIERHEHTGADGGKIEIEFKFDPRPPEQRGVIEIDSGDG